jgi:uncharacterized repeat protein (TIGR01451 family)
MGAGTMLACPAHADDTFPPCWRGRPGTTYQQWTFSTSANPATPEFVTNPFGAPQAAVTVGTAGAGWIDQQPIIFGNTRSGVWDLGRSGNIALSIPNDTAPAGSWKFVYVQVTQYRDSLYNQLATVSIPGATLVRSQLRTNEVLLPPTFPFNGRWVVEQSVWLLEPCPTSETVTISSGANNSVAIDQVVIDSRCSTGDEGDISAPCWRGRPGSTYQNWSFHRSGNPAAPEAASSPGSPQASITLGALALGWQDILVGFGCRQGYWDLGSVGQMSLTVPNTAGSPTSYKNIQVQVVEFQDSLAYNQLALVSIPGATMLSQSQTTVETTVTGSWVVHRSVWRIAPCPAGETVLITAPLGSALIDQVVVDTLCVDLGPACPSDQTLNADPGQCSAIATWTLPPADGCVITAAACTPASGSTFNVGSTPVSCTITDGSGGTVTCNFTVTVIDNQLPVVTCPADMLVGTSITPSLCGAVVNFTATATDNCPNPTVSCTPPSGSVFPLGMTTVTCRATDASVNLSTPCSFKVTVVDISGDEDSPCWRGRPGTTFQHWAFADNDNPAAPEFVASPGSPQASIALGALALGWQDVLFGFGCKQGYWDLGSGGTITLSVPNIIAPPTGYKYVRLQVTEFRDSLAYNVSPTKSVSGATLISQQETSIETTLTGEWIVHESIWRFAICPVNETILVTAPPTSALIDQIVVDTLCTAAPPCPTDITGDADPGLCVKTGVTWPLPTPDGCILRSIVCRTNGVIVTLPASFPVGQTAVTCSITDAENQIIACNFLVTINDVEPPVLVGVPPDQTVQCLTDVPSPANVTATDNCGAAVVTSTCTTNGACPMTIICTWTATDASSNSSSATSTFTVHDTIPPVLVGVPPNQSFQCLADVPPPANVTATDNCGPVSVVTTYTTNGACPMTIICTWTATDACTNSASATRTITVHDTIPPVLVGVPPNQSFQCLADVPPPANVTATDNCGPVSVVTTYTTNGACPMTIICTWTATDDCTNSASATRTITVHDTIPPVLVGVPPNQTFQCLADVPPSANVTATDNCGPVLVVTTYTTNGVSPLIITCTWTATDACTNSASATRTITVHDTTPPVIATCAPAQSANAGVNCLVAVPDFTGGVTASDNCDASLTVAQNPTAGTLVGAGAHTVTLTVTDDAGNSVSCTTTFTVQAVADLAVQVTSSPEPVTVGQPLTYTVTVTNLGPCPASGVIVNNVLSAAQVLVSVTDPGSTVARACPTPGPSVWYRAEGNANDSVGTSHGTISGGVAFTPQAVNQGFSFDGLTGYISVPDAPALRPASLTIEGWIKIQDPNGLHVLVSKPQGAGTADSYSLWIGSGVLFAAVSDNVGSGPLMSYPNLPVSSTFSGSDIINLPSLAAKLQTPPDPVSTFLRSRLSPATLTRLAAYGGGTDNVLLGLLVTDFNNIIHSGPIYTPARFAGVTLAPETSYLLGRNPTGTDLVRLNHLLIRDAYPTEVQSNVFSELNVRYHVAYTFDAVAQKQALYVNGALVDSGFVNKTIAYDNHAMFIGAANVGGVADHFYQGEMDELSIYNRALSGIEVEAVHNAGANGKCFNTGPVVIGSLASGASQSFAVATIPTTCPTASLQATVSAAETDLVLANNTATATATVVDLDPGQVRLTIRRVSPNNNHVEISWPITCAPYQLESTTDLGAVPIIWTPANVPLQILQGRRSTVIPADDPHRFFQLRSP